MPDMFARGPFDMGRRVYGYVKVSATDQNLDRQRKALDGVDLLIEEETSGRNRDRRVKLKTLIESAKSGDVIRVKSIDRLANTPSALLDVIDELTSKGVDVEFVDTPQLNVVATDKQVTLAVFAAFAQLERESVRERQLDGIALAKAAGKYQKNPKLTGEQVMEARQRVNMGVPKAAVARSLGVSRQTLYMALNGKGKYAEVTP